MASPATQLSISRTKYAVAPILMQVLLGMLYSWSVFRVPLAKAYGWTNVQTKRALQLLDSGPGGGDAARRALAGPFRAAPGGQRGRRDPGHRLGALGAHRPYAPAC